MVYKVCKGGVRSGNTLRGLHSRNSSKYSRHACLIGRSSMSRRDVSKMAECSTDDAMVTETVQSTDVILSLNKKQRWQLPATMRHLIRSGYFGNDAMVSVLERHKLKRRANCVSFVCNKGKVKSVQPTNQRYFSFNLDNIDAEQSKRQKRKEIAKERNTSKEDEGKTIKRSLQQMTEPASMDKQDTNDKNAHDAKDAKPEYSMEIFYPCPKTCSLTFNPKYTDVKIEVNEEGTQEVRAQKSPGSKKAKLRHRKRMTHSMWCDVGTGDIEDDLDQMWLEVFKEDCVPVDSTNVHTEEEEMTAKNVFSCTQNTANVDHQNEICEDDKTCGSRNVHGNLLAGFISQAEKAKGLGSNKRFKSRKRPSRRTPTPTSVLDDEPSKPHLIFISGEDEFRPKTTYKVPDQVKQEIVTKKVREHIDLFSFRVVFDSEEMSPVELEKKFGLSYVEAECKPRRFVLSLTDDVSNLLCPYKTCDQTLAYTSYVAFTYDGIYDNGLDVYNVSFNSYTYSSAKHMKVTLPLSKTFSIDDVINVVFDIILDMDNRNMLSISGSDFTNASLSDLLDFKKYKPHIEVESFYPSCKISLDLICLRDIDQQTEALSANGKEVNTLEDEDHSVCQICYESVSPSQMGCLPGTALTPCGHTFCNDCWKAHIRTKLSNGAVKILCPGIDCDVTVGHVTLLTLVHATEVGQLLQRQKEQEVESSNNAKWCPNASCGRIIKMDARNLMVKDLSYDVTCACGINVCFACLRPGHWPARCDQADEYTNRLEEISLPEEVLGNPNDVSLTPSIPPTITRQQAKGKSNMIIVEGRLCPRCRRFIEKDGGCNHMECMCGFEFCWDCLISLNNHLSQTCPADPKFLKENTMFKVLADESALGVADRSDDISVADDTGKSRGFSSRGSVSMYQKALHQRLEGSRNLPQKVLERLAMRIASAAAKDKSFKKELLSQCVNRNRASTCDDNVVYNIVRDVMKFLQSCDATRRALHHVTEFTFVLIQDIPQSLDRQRAFALANDMSGYCCFLRSVLETGDRKPVRTVVKRLLDIQTWARRAVGTLLKTVNRLKGF